MAAPEKDFFTLEEIAVRWKCIGVERSSFLDFANKDLLVFSTYIREIGSYREVTETPEGTITKIRSVTSFTAEGFKKEGIRYLKADDARRILEAAPRQEVAVQGTYALPNRDRESGMGYAPPIYLTAESLGVSRTERDRFEKAHHYYSLSAKLVRTWEWIAKDDNRKVLQWGAGGAAFLVGTLWGVFKFFYACN